MATTFTTTVRQVVSFTHPITSEYVEVPGSYTLTSCSKIRGPEQGLSDNAGFDLLYDASQTTLPVGDSDTGDAPFLFWIRLTSASGAILKFTDSNATIHYKTLIASQTYILPFNITGVASTDVIEQIDIQSLTATSCEYSYLFIHD